MPLKLWITHFWRVSLIMALITYFIVVLCYITLGEARNLLMEDPSMFEGDIELRPYQKLRIAMAKVGVPTYALRRDRKWPNARSIPYDIDRSIASDPNTQRSIQQAHQEIQRLTCIRFRKRYPNERAYLRYTNGNGCFSPVGYTRGTYNRIQLAPSCRVKEVVLHETLHSLGFWHEQNRPDRNTYVYIDYSNIIKGWAYAFQMRTYTEVDSKRSPYDFMSIMHYTKDAFAIDTRRPTIITRDSRYQNIIGTVKNLSAQDVFQLKMKYCY